MIYMVGIRPNDAAVADQAAAVMQLLRSLSRANTTYLGILGHIHRAVFATVVIFQTHSGGRATVTLSHVSRRLRPHHLRYNHLRDWVHTISSVVAVLIKPRELEVSP